MMIICGNSAWEALFPQEEPRAWCGVCGHAPCYNTANVRVLTVELIRIFLYDTDRHNVPHIHAEYQGQVAVYSIPDGIVLAGQLPTKKHKLVVAWIEIHQEDLLADWELAVNGRKPFPIRGLDQ